MDKLYMSDKASINLGSFVSIMVSERPSRVYRIYSSHLFLWPLLQQEKNIRQKSATLIPRICFFDFEHFYFQAKSQKYLITEII